MSFIALVDCNNFYVSCERVFEPRLNGCPVVVLSNNEGCIIARSEEAKALKIPMGAPYFQWKNFFKKHGVFTYSSNFPLYADMSQRVMQTLNFFSPEMEIYSIDEAFLKIDDKDPEGFCRNLYTKVLQWTGIEVSIGIAKTKTLAKAANYAVKKNRAFKGVYFPDDSQMSSFLDRLDVEEIWGIGRRVSKFLKTRGIHYALQLSQQDDLWIRKNLTVTGLKTVWELRGRSCLKLEEISPAKQSIMNSRTFGRPVTDREELFEAISLYASQGGEKLRKQNSLAQWMSVFLMTGFSTSQPPYVNQISLSLSEPTDYTPRLIEYAKLGIKRIYREGFSFRKAGVLLGGLVSKNSYQRDLFMPPPEENFKKKAAMELIDRLNQKYGYKILNFAALGTKRAWKPKKNFCSKSYTTKWQDLLTIQI